MKTIIFDIDSTISNPSHRLQYLLHKPKNWNAFMAGCVHDQPIEHTLYILNLMANNGDKIIILTARNSEMRENTIEWLEKHNIPYHDLYMRASKDYREDAIVKKELLLKIKEKYGEIFCAFDDRSRVLRMFESEGIFTFDVSQGKDY